MKRALIYILPILALFGACQKDTVSLNCEIVPFQGDSKVYINASDMAAFQANDYINVNRRTYRVEKVSNSYKLNGVDYSANGYKAIYPADGNTLEAITLPQNQVYTPVTEGNSEYQRVIAPMAAQGTSTLRFYNLCSLMEVTVTAPVANFTLRSIKVTSGTYPLWGTFRMDWDSIPSLSTPGTNSSADSNSVTLTCNYKFATANQAKSFFIILPPFSNPQSLTVEVDGIAPYSAVGSNHNVEYFIKNISSQNNTLAPSKIILGPTLATNDYNRHTGHWDPYEISTYEDLLFAASVINSGEVDNISGYRNGKTWKTGTWKIMNDIDCGNNTVIPLGAANLFEGILQGNNHTITYNKLADATGDIGLIGRTAAGAIIKDLTVEGNITADHIYGKQTNVIAGICGGVDGGVTSGRQNTDTLPNFSTNTTYIINCHNKANIGISTQTEGAYNYATGKAAHAAGVVGSVWGGRTASAVVVRNCSNSGNINGIISDQPNSGTGGIVGQHIQAISLIIDNCVNTGTITTNAINSDSTCGAGGILGNMYGTGNTPSKLRIINCENRGTITNASNTTNNKNVALGGICGLWGYNNTGFYIANCVNHGTVTHKNGNVSTTGYVGGILGCVNKDKSLVIKNCYSDGQLSGCNDNRRGGIYGKNAANKTTNCFYLATTANREGNTNTSVTGSTFTDTDTDYSTLLNNLNTWLTPANNPTDYPYAIWVMDNNGKPAPSGLPTVQ
ncbi:MAG: hypothetical protein MJZ67_05065 [Bacteroidales bacterium]|nr:hypothetical protein [Bacteroidales bacterium]